MKYLEPIPRFFAINFFFGMYWGIACAGCKMIVGCRNFL